MPKPPKKKQPATPMAEKPTTSLVQQSPASPNEIAKIIEYLKGSKLKKSQLETYKNQEIDKNLKNSIDLALKFWEIDGTSNNSYSSYQKELERDNNLKESELKSLIDSMCLKETPKYVKELPKSDQKKDITHLNNKLQ
jgi:hypothetical protein